MVDKLNFSDILTHMSNETIINSKNTIDKRHIYRGNIGLNWFENECKSLIEDIYDTQLVVAKPPWLVHPKTGKQLTIKLYSEKHKVAFECVTEIGDREDAKKEACKDSDIKIAYLVKPKKYKDLRKWLEEIPIYGYDGIIIEQVNKKYIEKVDENVIEYVNDRLKVKRFLYEKYGDYDRYDESRVKRYISKYRGNEKNYQAEERLDQEFNKFETKCKEYIIKYLGVVPTKVRLDTLRNKYTGKLLEIDLYVVEYKIGFECQGNFHYGPVDSEDRFDAARTRDIVKSKLCAKAGIYLVYIPYELYLNNELESYIVTICKYNLVHHIKNRDDDVLRILDGDD